MNSGGYAELVRQFRQAGPIDILIGPFLISLSKGIVTSAILFHMSLESKNPKFFIFPLIIVLLVVAYFLLWRFAGLPEYRELIGVVQGLLSRHGLWIVFVGAFIEGILLVGNYLPGGLVIFLAVISAGNDFTKIILVTVLVILGFITANVLNYFLGRFGWHYVLVKFGMEHRLLAAEEKWKGKSFKVIFFSYWQSNLAALTATAAGVLKISFKKFLPEALVGLVFWNIFWVLLVYVLREEAVNVITNTYIILGLVMLWGMYASMEKYKKLKS